MIKIHFNNGATLRVNNCDIKNIEKQLIILSRKEGLHYLVFENPKIIVDVSKINYFEEIENKVEPGDVIDE